MHHVKEHRAPVRYSLTAEEATELGRKLRAKGGMTDTQVRRQAKAMGCATKPIYMLASKMGVEIQTTRPSRPQAKTARERAEEVFRKPKCQKADVSGISEKEEDSVSSDPEIENGKSEENTSDFDAAVELLAEEERRIADTHRVKSEELAGRETDFVETAAEMQALLDEERERAREAIRRTAQLRRDTRSDRELIEELRGQITQMKVQKARLERSEGRARQVAHDHKKELKASMARERRLLEALAQSEADLAECRARSTAGKP